MTNQFTQTLKIEAWLQKREWNTKAISRIAEGYEQEIEKARVNATRDMIARLIRFEEEAKMRSTNSEYTARERQTAKTELNKISAEIERLMLTLDSEAICTSWEFRFRK